MGAAVSRLECELTIREAVGRALIAAGWPQAAVLPPDLPYHVGSVTPGWLLCADPDRDDAIRVYYRPLGVLGADTADVQRQQLVAYADALEWAGWATCLERRGLPFLRVWRAEPC